MPVIVVTRLRLRDPALLDEFFVSAAALLEQAQHSAGNLGADAMSEGEILWWTVSAWQDRDAMSAYVRTDPHLSAMGRIDGWCDEATFADWESESSDLPDWQICYDHLVETGQSAKLTNPSAANATRDFPRPLEKA